MVEEVSNVEVSIVSEPLEPKLRRLSDLLGFVDFAFPGAASMLFSDTDPTVFGVELLNVLESSVSELIQPKLQPSEILRKEYNSEEKRLRLWFSFDFEQWPQVLPIFFLPTAHGKSDKITPTHASLFLRALAEGEVDGRSYQEWITKNMTDES